MLLLMNDQRKPSDDFKEGLGLLFRAAKSAVQSVDVGKVDKTLNQVFTEAGRVASTVGKVVVDEVTRMSSSKKPESSEDRGDVEVSPAERAAEANPTTDESAPPAASEPSADKGATTAAAEPSSSSGAREPAADGAGSDDGATPSNGSSGS